MHFTKNNKDVLIFSKFMKMLNLFSHIVKGMVKEILNLYLLVEVK